MCKVSVGFVSKILLVLTQSLHVVRYKRSTLVSIDDFLVTTESYYYCHFTIMSFDHACRLFGNVIVLFPD